MAGLHRGDRSGSVPRSWVVILGARVGRVRAIHDPCRRRQMHVARALLALDILIDILDVGDHGVLTRGELVVWYSGL